MIKTKRSLIAATVLVAASMTSHAGALYKNGKYHSPQGPFKTDSTTPSNLYANVYVGYGQYDIGDDDGIDDDGVAALFSLGYRFNKHAAIEAGFLSLPDIGIKAWGESATLSTYGLVIAGKAFMPIQKDIEGFVTAGATALKESLDYTSYDGHHVKEPSSSVFTGLWGLGVNFKVKPNVDFSLQGLSTTKKGGEMPASYMALAGLSFKFA
jgi:hypothetical protein